MTNENRKKWMKKYYYSEYSPPGVGSKPRAPSKIFEGYETVFKYDYDRGFKEQLPNFLKNEMISQKLYDILIDENFDFLFSVDYNDFCDINVKKKKETKNPNYDKELSFYKKELQIWEDEKDERDAILKDWNEWKIEKQNKDALAKERHERKVYEKLKKKFEKE